MQLDLTYLNEIANNDRNFVLDILRMFMQQTAPDIDRLQSVINEEDYAVLYSAVHKIKSSIMMLGNDSANELITQLETQIKSKAEWSNIRYELNSFLTIAHELKRAVADELIKG